MLSVSNEFRKDIAQNTQVLLKGRVDFPSGEKLDLEPGDFMGQGAVFAHATSTAGSFDIGAVVSGTVDVTLRNDDGRLDEYDFSRATITLWVGKELSTGVEWLRKGKYWIDQPDSYGEVFGFTALDATSLLDVPYSEVATPYPATLQEIVDKACSHCGVTVATASFPNGGYVVEKRPDDSAITCRDVVSYAAQASGNFVRARQSDDAIEVSWYDTAAMSEEDWLDGGYFDAFKPYLSGDVADGGTFDDYSSGYDADGGSFTSRALPVISAMSSLTLCTDDVLVTGVQVSVFEPEVAEDGTETLESALFGKEGYVLDVGSNPLVQKGSAAKLAEAIGGRVVGMRFRPFDASALGAPYLEPGDAVLLVDRNQRYFPTYLTSVGYRTNGYAAYACTAETPARRTAQRFAAETQALVKNKNLISREREDRKRAIAELERIVEEGGGLYQTVETKTDGSKVYYMHDRPTVAESKVVWRMGAEALAVSTDGGKTYATGFTADGDAVLKRIYAIGIDGEYIKAGTVQTDRLVSSDDKKTFVFDGDKVSIKNSGKDVLLLRYDPSYGGYDIGVGANVALTKNGHGFKVSGIDGSVEGNVTSATLQIGDALFEAGSYSGAGKETLTIRPSYATDLFSKGSYVEMSNDGRVRIVCNTGNRGEFQNAEILLSGIPSPGLVTINSGGVNYMFKSDGIYLRTPDYRTRKITN